MKGNEYDFNIEPEQRPSFLTWLCILTFIGSGWGIISSIGSYTTALKTSTFLSQNKNVDTNSMSLKDTADAMERNHAVIEQKIKASFSRLLKKENIEKAAIGNFMGAILTLAGALMMWNLKRIGFYIYILGVVFGILMPFYIFGNDMIAVGATSFPNFFGLIFIALYALNIKSMRRRQVG
ncbi:MAG: hypothetical protein ABI372_09835 [Ginsengibacter sp.]